MRDITVDTNVLMHSCNPGESRHAASAEFIQGLLASDVCVAIDDGFSVNETENRSLIGAEYLAKLVPGSLPFQALRQLALTGRMIAISARLDPHASKRLNRMISNRRDRTFVKVCANSSGKTLASHDFQDFTQVMRDQLRTTFSVRVLEACDCTPLMRASA